MYVCVYGKGHRKNTKSQVHHVTNWGKELQFLGARVKREEGFPFKFIAREFKVIWKCNEI
jgi:hypothetical protein